MELKMDNMTINYHIYGQGKPILMLHGFYPDHRLMKGCLEPIFINRNGWQRIYLDLPGMGRTPGRDWINNSDDMLQVVIDFIDKIIPNQRFTVIGESYGAYLAQGLIVKKGDFIDGMTLICPVVIADKEKRSVPEHEVLIEDRELLSSLTADEEEEFSSMAVVQNKRNWERFRDEILPGLGVADEVFLEKVREQGYGFSFSTQILTKPFPNPVLIMTGRQDASVGYVDSFNILNNFPRATYAVLDMAGHNLQIEQEGLFNSFINEWLDRVEEQSSLLL